MIAKALGSEQKKGGGRGRGDGEERKFVTPVARVVFGVSCVRKLDYGFTVEGRGTAMLPGRRPLTPWWLCS